MYNEDVNLLRAQLLIEAADLLDEAHVQDPATGKYMSGRVNTNTRVAREKEYNYLTSDDFINDVKKEYEKHGMRIPKTDLSGLRMFQDWNSRCRSNDAIKFTELQRMRDARRSKKTGRIAAKFQDSQGTGKYNNTVKRTFDK